ncbi:transcription factor GTE12-like [Arachis ipaensis]|uniref:transcription factor GTE12-like n=1 Tax=Arachis ipaensis TaxID=130454 RepID=UPI0007AF0036|nr:transcription factor GTE12-like [Arachis ipaensis]XP_025652008.1 transcription factor GTE12-like [Arachis hypogaea]
MFSVTKSSTFVPANPYSTVPKKSSDAANKRVPEKRVFSSSILFSHVHRFNDNNNNNRNSIVLDSRANKRAKVEKSEENSRMKKGTTDADAVKEREEKNKLSSSGMDGFKNMQCSVTLRGLLVHPDGVYFKKGKALMDLERVQRKLWNNLYNKTDQFAADIRTVFRNVMSQYPSGHEVHQTAAKLSDLFETKWRNLEGRWLAEKENKLEKEEPKPNSKPLKSNAGQKRKQFSGSDLSIAIAKAKLILEKKKTNEAAQQNRVCLQRKKQREMMQKMERTIFFDDAFKSFQDLENLCGHSLTHYCTKENPLMKNLTGLVLKEEDFEDNNFLSEDLEEGEVF